VALLSLMHLTGNASPLPAIKVLVIIFPLARIIPNASAHGVQFPLVADDSFVIIALPHRHARGLAHGRLVVPAHPPRRRTGSPGLGCKWRRNRRLPGHNRIPSGGWSVAGGTPGHNLIETCQIDCQIFPSASKKGSRCFRVAGPGRPAGW
jgi:hypothetical protein